jgi:uncharacterized protein (DUF3820 family)/LmbE family N-acetylglucosaminyl deacetylase
MGTHLQDLDGLLQPASAPRSLHALHFPARLQVLVLAPHPDDFDAIGITLRHLHEQGHELHLAVLTTGASGVDEGFEGAVDDEAKAALREAEQRASCAFFGLPAERLHFLRLWTDASNDADEASDQARLQAWMAERPADLLFLPHGNDSNRTHRRTYEAVQAAVLASGQPAWAFLNQDAKTLQMRFDVFLEFGEQDAQWKRELLRCHRSQQARNLRTRGVGFDARVLEVNRQAALSLASAHPYTEVFEVTRLGAASKDTPQASAKSEALLRLVHTEMPYGKHKGTRIADLPGNYLNWFAREGFPPGEIGRLLALMHEIDHNGLKHLLAPLRSQAVRRSRRE